MQRENDLLGNQDTLIGNRRITSEAALEKTYKIFEESHVSKSDWKISEREPDHFKTLLATIEIAKGLRCLGNKFPSMLQKLTIPRMNLAVSTKAIYLLAKQPPSSTKFTDWSAEPEKIGS